MRTASLIFLFFVATYCSAQSNSPGSKTNTQLPAVLQDGRFYLKIAAANGDTLLAFCDTGGGFTAIYPATVARLKLEKSVTTLDIEGEKINYILAREIIKNDNIPLPSIAPFYRTAIADPFFELADEKEMGAFNKYIPQDLFLGQFFFISHAWTFNYLTGKVYINTPLPADAKDGNMQILGFKKDRSGNKRYGHPSMKIIVDGEIIDVLLDTGASFILGSNGKAEFGMDKASAGGSFIAKSIFEMWHQKHPDWKVIEKAELNGADMIRVPVVQAGNLTTGPVWFSKRPDEAWSKGMILSMDKIVKGAVGGSFFKYFKVQIDYNSELVKFEK